MFINPQNVRVEDVKCLGLSPKGLLKALLANCTRDDTCVLMFYTPIHEIERIDFL